MKRKGAGKARPPRKARGAKPKKKPKQGPKAGKRAGAKKARKQGPARAQKKVIEKRKALMKEAETLLTAIVTHPMLRGRGELEQAEGKLVSLYRGSDEVVQQYMLFLVHEQLCRSAGFKAVQNFEHFKRLKGEKAEVLEVRRAVYRSMFNYTNSLEGQVSMLSLLGELGDEGAAKLISHHFAHYSSTESVANQMLRNAAVDALAECSSLYALDVLLTYSRYSERNERMLFALGEWERKLAGMKLPQERKAGYTNEIHTLIMAEGGKGAHYR